MDIEQLRLALVQYLLIVICIVVHEWAHCWAADKLGDRTARSMGRLTLNPVAHMDPIGTVAIPLLMLIFSPGFVFPGWGKPAPVEVSQLRNRTWGDVLVTLAGPLSNLVLGLIGTALLIPALLWQPTLVPLVFMFIGTNAVLIVFNLLPIPPLDGGRIMRRAIGMSEETFLQWSLYGGFLLLLLLNLPPFRLFIATLSSGLTEILVLPAYWVASLVRFTGLG